MEKTTKYFLYGILFGFFIILFLGIYIYLMDFQAINIFQLKDKCHVMLRNTCELVNKQNDIINNKLTPSYESCHNITNGTLQRLSKLDCNTLP